jgi:hypothetical protein
MAKVGLMDEVHVRIDFVVPAQDIEIIGAEEERPRHVEVPRQEGEQNGDGKTEPEDSGVEQVVIVTVDWRRKPPRGDDGINSLTVWIRYTPTTVMETIGTYSICPDENNANEHGKEHPTGPKPRIEPVEEI